VWGHERKWLTPCIHRQIQWVVASFPQLFFPGSMWWTKLASVSFLAHVNLLHHIASYRLIIYCKTYNVPISVKIKHKLLQRLNDCFLQDTTISNIWESGCRNNTFYYPHVLGATVWAMMHSSLLMTHEPILVKHWLVTDRQTDRQTQATALTTHACAWKTSWQQSSLPT